MASAPERARTVGTVFPEVRTHAMFISASLVAIQMLGSISNISSVLQNVPIITQSVCRAFVQSLPQPH